MKVTIRVERADGQFTIAQTNVPDELPDPFGESGEAFDRKVNAAGDKIRQGFLEAYARALRLPE